MEKYLPEGFQTTIGQQCSLKNMQQLKEFLAFPFKIILLLRFKKLIKNGVIKL